MNTPYLSIVIPAYNEEDRIHNTLKDITSHLSHQRYTWKIVVVNDGSTDQTGKIVESWATGIEEISLMNVAHGGKGWAVKQGMLSTSGQYIFMCDADLSMPIAQIDKFLSQMEAGYDVAIGSREALGARRYGEPILRHIMGRIFNWAVQILAVQGLQDTQCGFKCFRKDVALKLFSKQKSMGFGFDVEILYLAFHSNMRVIEIPIEWYHKESGKVRPMVDSFLMLKDVLYLKFRGLGRYKN